MKVEHLYRILNQEHLYNHCLTMNMDFAKSRSCILNRSNYEIWVKLYITSKHVLGQYCSIQNSPWWKGGNNISRNLYYITKFIIHLKALWFWYLHDPTKEKVYCHETSVKKRDMKIKYKGLCTEEFISPEHWKNGIHKQEHIIHLILTLYNWYQVLHVFAKYQFSPVINDNTSSELQQNRLINNALIAEKLKLQCKK
jgi:hypothetical protein